MPKNIYEGKIRWIDSARNLLCATQLLILRTKQATRQSCQKLLRSEQTAQFVVRCEYTHLMK